MNTKDCLTFRRCDSFRLKHFRVSNTMRSLQASKKMEADTFKCCNGTATVFLNHFTSVLTCLHNSCSNHTRELHDDLTQVPRIKYSLTIAAEKSSTASKCHLFKWRNTILRHLDRARTLYCTHYGFFAFIVHELWSTIGGAVDSS